MRERCENCRFWKRVDAGDQYEGIDGPPWMSEEEPDKFVVGECWRFPPRISDRQIVETLKVPLYAGKAFIGLPVSVVLGASLAPVTWDYDWCGEWQTKKKPLKVPSIRPPWQPPNGDILAAPLFGPGAFPLLVRARKCVSRLGLNTVADLIQRTADDVLGARNTGPTTLAEIREKLARFGLALKGDPAPPGATKHPSEC